MKDKPRTQSEQYTAPSIAAKVESKPKYKGKQEFSPIAYRVGKGKSLNQRRKQMAGGPIARALGILEQAADARSNNQDVLDDRVWETHARIHPPPFQQRRRNDPLSAPYSPVRLAQQRQERKKTYSLYGASPYELYQKKEKMPGQPSVHKPWTVLKGYDPTRASGKQPLEGILVTYDAWRKVKAAQSSSLPAYGSRDFKKAKASPVYRLPLGKTG